MMGTLLSVYVFGIFDILVFYYYLQGIFEKRWQDKWRNGCILGAGVLLALIQMSFRNSNINIIFSTIINLTLSLTLFKGNWKSILFFDAVFIAVAVSMEGVVAYTLVAFHGARIVAQDVYSFLGGPIPVIITKTLTYLVILIMEGVLSKRNVGKHSYSLSSTLFLPITTLVLILGIQMSLEGSHELMLVGCMMLLFANLVVFYYIEGMAAAQSKNKEYELLRTQNEMKEVYYEKMEEISLEHRKYVHNLKDYLQTIGGLARRGDDAAIIELLKGMETEVESIQDKRYTGNSILNALLCEKESVAEKAGIVVQITPAPELQFEFVSNNDLIVMVGNLLDNAIEAAQQCWQEKKIWVAFSQEPGNFVTIQVENTYGGIIKKVGTRLQTTKENAQMHGLGIRSVEECAEKYGGMLVMEQKDKIFSVILTLSRVYYKG